MPAVEKSAFAVLADHGRARVTQAEVAADIGIDQSYVSRVERGSHPASDRIVRYYSERFGAPDLLASLVEIPREAERDRRKRRSPLQIAKQSRYPIEGDAAAFVSESPPDGSIIPCGTTFTKTWTIHNTGTVPWIGRRLRRIGPTLGPWTLASERFTRIPDAEPGQETTISVTVRAPQMETAAVAQWKMVDPEDLLYFPDRYSVD